MFTIQRNTIALWKQMWRRISAGACQLWICMKFAECFATKFASFVKSFINKMNDYNFFKCLFNFKRTNFADFTDNNNDNKKGAKAKKCMIWFLQTMPISHLRNEKRLTLNSIEWFIFVLRTEIPQYWRSEIEKERNEDMRKQVNSQLTMESLNLNGTTVIFSRLLQAWENRNR